MISIRENLPFPAATLPEGAVEALGANQMRLQRENGGKRSLGLDGLRCEDTNGGIERGGEEQKGLNEAGAEEPDGIRFHR